MILFIGNLYHILYKNYKHYLDLFQFSIRPHFIVKIILLLNSCKISVYNIKNTVVKRGVFMYRLENVKYRDILYIENLEILPKKITCILGESGGGKTTLIKLLNKMISPTSGDIFYKKKSLRKIDSVELRREVVMLSQSPGIFPGSVRDNLLIGLKFSEKNPADDSELVEIMKKVHLYKSLDDVAENLSGGEKQRVALGRVMLMDPKILLLDEPSSALDEKTEKNIIKEVTDYVKTKNKTLIVVTHSKEIARDHADEIIEMAQGRIIDKKVVERNG